MCKTTHHTFTCTHNYTTTVLYHSTPPQTLFIGSIKPGFSEVHYIHITPGVVRLEPYERSAYANLLGARREHDGHSIDVEDVKGEWCDGCAREEWKRMERVMVKGLDGVEVVNGEGANIE
jgi:hypothetical protein